MNDEELKSLGIPIEEGEHSIHNGLKGINKAFAQYPFPPGEEARLKTR